MDYGFYKAFDQLCSDVAELKVTVAQQAIDRAALDALTQRLKDSGEALQAKVDANPAPAPT